MARALRARSHARAVALQYLYRVDLVGPSRRVELDDFLDGFYVGEELPAVERPAREYAEELIAGVLRRRDELDEQIASAARNWTVDRMAVVDRNVLRLALYELRHSEVPPKVVIDEAVELGKTYSTEGTGAFVNGVLDALFRSLSRAPGREVATETQE